MTVTNSTFLAQLGDLSDHQLQEMATLAISTFDRAVEDLTFRDSLITELSNADIEEFFEPRDLLLGVLTHAIIELAEIDAPEWLDDVVPQILQAPNDGDKQLTALLMGHRTFTSVIIGHSPSAGGDHVELGGEG